MYITTTIQNPSFSLLFLAFAHGTSGAHEDFAVQGGGIEGTCALATPVLFGGRFYANPESEISPIYHPWKVPQMWNYNSLCFGILDLFGGVKERGSLGYLLRGPVGKIMDWMKQPQKSSKIGNFRDRYGRFGDKTVRSLGELTATRYALEKGKSSAQPSAMLRAG